MPNFDFNPHPYVRDDQYFSPVLYAPADFNPHPYVRDDVAISVIKCITVYFNPHPYVRDDCNTAQVHLISALRILYLMPVSFILSLCFLTASCCFQSYHLCFHARMYLLFYVHSRFAHCLSRAHGDIHAFRTSFGVDFYLVIGKAACHIYAFLAFYRYKSKRLM